ncbi:hypothetical protein FB451DRAFT_1568773 [Mycena latifolia]|nr:hypothetical protein FB451DRAFT_1568773 [Mycena latifolia]
MRGMYLIMMLDVVINHYAGVPTNITLSGLFTFDFASLLPLGTEPRIPSAKLPLPDIDTEDATIVATLSKWIKDTVAEYGIDDVRIDTVKHIRHDFWADFSASAGVFTLGEGPTLAPPSTLLITAFSRTSGNLSALESLPALSPLSSTPSTLTAAGYETNKPFVAHIKALNGVRRELPHGCVTFAFLFARRSRSSPGGPEHDQALFLTNIGANATRQPTWSIPVGLYAPNTTLVDALACAALVVGADGATNVSAKAGLLQVLIPANMLNSAERA